MTVSISGYSVVSRLGEGGMGSVFKAVHDMTGREVAIKVLRPDLAKDEHFRRRFLREARASAALNHPNITKVYDAGEQSGIYYIVMEYIEGETVSNIIRATRPFNPEYALIVTREAATGLAHAHDKGIIHRDIKPDNIMLNLERVTKITDMGLAKKMEADDEGTDITLTGTVLGTPKYMSPEQVLHPDSIDHRSDIYSLGATLFYLLTGKPPFDGETSGEVIVRVCKETPSIPKDLPRPVAKLLRALLAKERKKRPRSAGALVEMIDETLEELQRPEPEHRPGTREPVRMPPSGSNRGLLLALAGIAATAVIVIALALAFGRSKKPDTTEPPGGGAAIKPSDTPADAEKTRLSVLGTLYEDILKYANKNPDDYAGIVGKYESLLPKASADVALSSKIKTDIASWKRRWEDAARRDWDEATESAKRLLEAGDYQSGARLWESFIAKYKNLGDYGERAENLAVHFSEIGRAMTAIADTVKATDRDFNAENIGEAQETLKALNEFAEKYKTLAPVVEKVEAASAKLRQKIAGLQKQDSLEDFFGAVIPPLRRYDVAGAFDACKAAYENPRQESLKPFIEQEIKDIGKLAEALQALKENMEQAVLQKKTISLKFLDGTTATGPVSAEGKTLIITSDKSYAVKIQVLHPNSIVEHADLLNKVPASTATILLLYAHSSLHEEAGRLFQAAKVVFTDEQIRYYERKLAYLKKNYPFPEQRAPEAAERQIPQEAQLWAEITYDLKSVHRTGESSESLLNAVKLAPGDSRLAYKAINTVTWLHDYKQALELAKNALVSHQDDADLIRSEALALHFTKKYRNALRCVDKAIEKDEKSDLSYLVKAGVLNMLKKSREARETALKVWRLEDPNFSPVHMSDKEFAEQLAQARDSIRTAEYEKAALLGLRLVAARPEDAEPYCLLGLISVHMNEYTDAQELFVAAVLLDPKNARAYINLAYAYLRQGEPDLVIATLDAAKKLRPSKDDKDAIEQYVESAGQAIQQREELSKKSYDEGKALYSSGRFAEALPKFKAAVKLKDSSPYWWQGHCCYKLRRLPEALRAFDKAILLKPTVHDNHYGKALVLRGLNRHEDAIESFKKCSELYRKANGKDHYESWVGIADCCRRLGKTEEAAEAQRKARALGPNK